MALAFVALFCGGAFSHDKFEVGFVGVEIDIHGVSFHAATAPSMVMSRRKYCI